MPLRQGGLSGEMVVLQTDDIPRRAAGVGQTRFNPRRGGHCLLVHIYIDKREAVSLSTARWGLALNCLK